MYALKRKILHRPSMYAFSLSYNYIYIHFNIVIISCFYIHLLYRSQNIPYLVSINHSFFNALLEWIRNELERTHARARARTHTHTRTHTQTHTHTHTHTHTCHAISDFLIFLIFTVHCISVTCQVLRFVLGNKARALRVKKIVSNHRQISFKPK